MKRIDARAKQLIIRTKHAIESAYVGGHVTRKRGFGFEFDQLRDYDEGDDIRSIDWAASARTDDLFVRQYREERSRSICVLIDTSSSMRFGSTVSKFSVAREMGIALATAAWHNGDAFGLGTFSDQLEQWTSPRFGYQNYVQSVALCAGLSLDRWSRKTHVKHALTHGKARMSSRALWIVISDFYDDAIHRVLGTIHQSDEVVAIRLLDAMELDPPAIAGATMHDCEYAYEREADGTYAQWLKNKTQVQRYEQRQLLQRHGVDCFDCLIQREWLRPLIKFFSYRGMA